MPTTPSRCLLRALTATVLTLTLAALPGVAFADDLAVDPGLDFSLSIPEADISTVGPTIDGLTGGGHCMLGSLGMTTLVKRTAGLTSVYEAGTVKASSTCASLTVKMTIIDHDLTGASPDHTTSRTASFAARKGSTGTSQTVSWASTVGTFGVRPATKVSFKGFAQSGSDTE